MYVAPLHSMYGLGHSLNFHLSFCCTSINSNRHSEYFRIHFCVCVHGMWLFSSVLKFNVLVIVCEPKVVAIMHRTTLHAAPPVHGQVMPIFCSFASSFTASCKEWCVPRMADATAVFQSHKDWYQTRWYRHVDRFVTKL